VGAAALPSGVQAVRRRESTVGARGEGGSAPATMYAAEPTEQERGCIDFPALAQSPWPPRDQRLPAPASGACSTRSFFLLILPTLITWLFLKHYLR